MVAFSVEHVDDPVPNITTSITPDLITRQRQNMAALRARGFDLEALFQFKHAGTNRIEYVSRWSPASVPTLELTRMWSTRLVTVITPSGRSQLVCWRP